MNFALRAFNYLLRYLKFNLLSKGVILGKGVYIHLSARLITDGENKIQIGSGTQIMQGVIISTSGGSIKIGKNCSLNPYTIIYGHGNTTIGDNVLIAGHCMIIPSEHIFSNQDKNIVDQGVSKKGIEIGNNIWIGHGCTITDGVIISDGSVVGAGSVVTKSIPPNSVYAGIPAKELKNRIL